jgi:hypothetical protein
VKAVKLRLDGQFEDAFVYMGRLILVTTSGAILIVPLERLVDQLASGRTRRLLRVLFEHNDHMTVRDFIRAADGAEKANKELAALVRAEFSAQVEAEAEVTLRVAYSAPMDLLLYYRRLYFATDQGLFTRDIDFDPPVASPDGRTIRRTEQACLAVSARYGTINASCEGDGLFQAIDEFGWLGPRRNNGMSRIARASRRTSWLRNGFVNYVTNRSITLFETKTQRIPLKPSEDEHDEAGRLAISSVVPSDDEAGVMRQLAEEGIHDRDITHVWSSLNGIFVQSSKGLVFIRLSLEADEQSSSVVRLGQGFGSVIWAGTFGRGTVVETQDSVIAFERHQQLIVESGPVISTRTFPNSIRYRRLVVTVREESVVLTSILNDYMLKLEA